MGSDWKYKIADTSSICQVAKFNLANNLAHWMALKKFEEGHKFRTELYFPTFYNLSYYKDALHGHSYYTEVNK